MNFRDIKKLESNFTKKPLREKKSIKEVNYEDNIDKHALNDLILSEEKKKQYFKNPLEYFYQDTISEKFKFDFKTALGSSYYNPASDDALACLEICCFNELNPYKVHGWLVSAFKFIDHFVLHYIQDIKKEVIAKKNDTPEIIQDTSQKKIGDEMSRYVHLIKYKGEIAKAGLYLKLLYQLRNRKLEHRTRIFTNGKQELLKPDRKAAFIEIRYKYPEIMKIFLKEYKSTFPNCL